MTLSPTVPRFRLRVASIASCRMESVTPKERLVPSVPPIDWKVRSTGAPRSIHSSEVVTWERMHPCVGMA